MLGLSVRNLELMIRIRGSGCRVLGFRACGNLLLRTQDSTSHGRAGGGGLDEQDFQGGC